MTDYKKYALNKLEEWIHDCLSSGDATPQEIYDTIKGVVEEQYYYFKDQTSRCYELLALLHSGVDNNKYQDYLNKVLSCDKNNISPECQGAWNDFWEENYYPEEHSSHYYDYTRNNMNKENPFENKKWVLPVEMDGPSGEYFISFPDDLLEATKLQEGDEVYWVDNKDGTFTLRKVTKPLGMDEC